MVLENLIRDKIIELESSITELVEIIGDNELAEKRLYAVDVLNEIIEQYNNGK